MPGPYLLIDELPERSGTPFNAYGAREYARRFLVQVTDRRMATVSVCLAPGLPLPWAFYVSQNGVEFDTQALMIRMSAEQQDREDWQFWVVTCLYSTEMPNSGQPDIPGYPGPGGTAGPNQGAANSPDLEPPEISWDYEIVQMAVPFDREGNAFTDATGTPYSPPPVFEIAHPVLTIVRNELSFDIRKAKEYAYALNDRPFLGEIRGRVQCLPPRAVQMFKGPLVYARVTYKLRVFTVFEELQNLPQNRRPNVFKRGWKLSVDGPLALSLINNLTWQPVILNAGYNIIDDSDPFSPTFLKAVPRRPPNRGAAFSTPQLLNENGGPLDTTLYNPMYHQYEVYKYKDFKDLLVKGLGFGG